MKTKKLSVTVISAMLFTVLAISGAQASGSSGKIVHDAEYYILEAQNGEKWAGEDRELDQKLSELQQKYGRPPNIIHIMWDDTPFGDIGIPAIQKVRGFETPRLNTMAEEGIMFTRMYTEVGCTPSRAASATGRLAVRSGMYNIGMLLEMHGMRGPATPRPSMVSGIWATLRRATLTTRALTRLSSPATTRFYHSTPG